MYMADDANPELGGNPVSTAHSGYVSVAIEL